MGNPKPQRPLLSFGGWDSQLRTLEWSVSCPVSDLSAQELFS